MIFMSFFYTPLPLWLAAGGWIVTAVVLALACWKKPLRRLQDGTLQHVWFGVVVAVTVLWACNTWFEDGPAIHLLGATLVVTLFDWQLGHGFGEQTKLFEPRRRRSPREADLPTGLRLRELRDRDGTARRHECIGGGFR